MMKKLPYLPGVLIVVFIGIIYSPALNIYLMGDDFEWLNVSYAAWKTPLALFESINNFFRPLVKLSYLLNYTIFRTQGSLYSATTIGIHIVNVFLLYMLLFKVSRKISIAGVITIIFGTSTLYGEVTLWAAGRPDSLLLLFMLGVLIIADNSEGALKKKRQIAFILLTVGAIGSKETWVLLPFLVLSFLCVVKKTSFKTALKTTWSLFLLLALYLAVFIGWPLLSNTTLPTAYASADIRSTFLKFCELLFTYIGLSKFYAGEVWQLLLSIIAVIGFGYWLIRRKNRLALWGMFWMLLTISISLPIRYAPSRYNYLPLIGFWMMIVAFLDKEIEEIRARFKIQIYFASLLIISFVVLQVSYQSIMLQNEISDYTYHGNSHKTVVALYNQIKSQIPLDNPILFVNRGTRKPIFEIAESSHGYPKLFFVRGRAIWQLVYLAPLVNFAGEPFKRLMVPVQQNDTEKILQEKFTVIVFTDRGFFFTHKHDEELQRLYMTHNRLPDNVEAYQFISMDDQLVSETPEL